MNNKVNWLTILWRRLWRLWIKGDYRPWVYIAGPYSLGDPVANTRKAIAVANMIVDYGVVPIVPHKSLVWDLSHPRPPEFWYDYTMELLRRCDAIYRMPGESWGADREVDYAGEGGHAILLTLPALVNWCMEHGVR